MLWSCLIVFCVLSCSGLVEATFAIKGVHEGVNAQTGERPSRQDFNVFQNSGPAFDLYVLALREWQSSEQSELVSYYQVSGIHGYPNTPWDDVAGGSYTIGYCTHSSILFPSWHRPYLALFEQRIWDIAQQISERYPDDKRETYNAAARTLRIPYWDWSLKVTMPALLNEKQITVNTPTGVQTIDNPLYSYTFHPLSAQDFPPGDGQIALYPRTVRYPDSNGNSRPDLVNAQLQANAQNIHDQVYQLLASQSKFGPFSNTAWKDDTGISYNSIENIHNQIHSLTGNGGHMSYVPYAAFDPIFWLHHTNIDRLVAIWEVLYPDSYITPQPESFGTFTNPPNSIDDVNTPLTPFHIDSTGTLYTGAETRNIQSFGYTYPEIVDWNVNATQLSANVRTIINKLYNPAGTISTRSHIARGMKESGITSSIARGLSRESLEANAANYQWVVQIRADKNLIPYPLFLHFYLSEPADDNPSRWSYDPALVGTHSILILPTSAKQSSPSNQQSAGQIPLTQALLPISGNLQPSSVLPVIKGRLQWRGQKFDDSVVDRDILAGWAGVEIQIAGRPVQQRVTGDKFPTYGTWKIYGKGVLGQTGQGWKVDLGDVTTA